VNSTGDINQRQFQTLQGLGVLLLWLLVGLVYHDALKNGFHFDDEPNITEHTSLHVEELSVGSLLDAASSGFLANRFVPNLTFAIDWWRGGGSPSAFQMTNLVVHGLVTSVLFLLLAHLLNRAFDEHRARSFLLLVAFFAAALWAFHPMQIQAVTYIVQRMAELAALFTLLAVYCYLRARQRGLHFGWVGACVAAMLLGAFSKENAWITPLLLLVAEFSVVRIQGPLWRYRFDRYVAVLPLVVVVIVACDLLLSGPLTHSYVAGYGARDFTLWERLLTQPRVILFHLSQFALPLPDRFSVFHDFTLSTSIFSPVSTLLALLFWGFWIVGGIFALRLPVWRLFGFFLLWVPVSLAIESSFIPLEMVFEHRMYLPSVGLVGAAAFLVVKVSHSRLAVVSVGSVLLAAVAWSTMIRLPVWETNLTLYGDAIAHAPNNRRAHYNYANALRNDSRFNLAVKHYRRALEIRDERPEVHNNLALAYLKMGEEELARTELQRALALHWQHFNSLVMLAGLEAESGDRKLAEVLLKRAISVKQGEAEPRLRLADLYLGQGRFVDAQRIIVEGLQYSPQNAELHNELGRIAGTQRQPESAKQHFATALSIRPDYLDALVNLSGALIELQQLQEAETYLRRALVLDPSHPQAKANLQVLRRMRAGRI
jgi:Tfp pilus assembly protein PilF